jgi:hypothetical protein
MKQMTVDPIIGHSVRFPPGQVRITLNADHRRAYLRLFGAYFPLTDVPALKDDDFDGRSIRMSKPELAALNRRFLTLADVAEPGPPGVFRDQEQSLEKNAKAMQFLS